MRIEYLPESIRFRGKLYRPRALVITDVRIGEPSRCAMTATPSIAPSACEVTLPVSAAGV